MLALAALLFQVDVSGEVDLRYVHRSRTLERAARALDGRPAGSPGDADYFYDRTAVRLDVAGPGPLGWRLGVETPTLDDGETVPLGLRSLLSPRGGPPLLIREAFVGWGDPVSDPIAARLGFQPLRLQNRPPGLGEPFFLSLGESESAWAGPTFPGATPTHSTTAVRNVAARDRLDFAGARVHYNMNPFVMVEGFAATTAGLQTRDREEMLAGFHAGAAIFESASVSVTAVYQHGPYAGADLGTVGVGVDGYLDEGRTLELFAEVYGQFGSLIDHKGIDVGKRGAYAWTAGARKSLGEFWVEASLGSLSGDARPGDGADNAFQSHEDVDQFLIVESDDFGLDVDTNYRSAKLSVGRGLGDELIREGEVFARLDVGYFELDEPPAGPFGASPTRSRDLGLEVDATLTWRVVDRLDLTVRAAGLFSSNVLDALSGDSDAWMITVGPRFRF